MGRIAILMSTYNGETYLSEQIDSIMQQTCAEDIDLWVRDDGSTDNTLSILRKYELLGALHLVVGSENLKPARSFLELLRICGDYEFYMFADQDDYWYPEKVQASVDCIRHLQVPAISYCNARLVDSQLKPVGRLLYRNAPHTDLYTITCAANVLGCAMAFNHLLVHIIRSHDSPLVISMHDSFVTRVCVAVGGVVIYNDITYMDYRQHSDNVIGVRLNKRSIIKQRINDIVYPANTSIADQAQEIVRLYSDIISKDNLEWLQRVIKYKRTLISRALLACTHKTHYITLNMSLKLRMSILLGNR